MEKQEQLPPQKSADFGELEREGEAFIDNLFEFFLQRKKLRSSIEDLEILEGIRSSVKDLELAKEINKVAGQRLSDEVPLSYLRLPSAEKELGGMRGIMDQGFRRNYGRILGALGRGHLRTVGDIRDASPFRLVRLESIQMDSVAFIKTIFARPQIAESK